MNKEGYGELKAYVATIRAGMDQILPALTETVSGLLDSFEGLLKENAELNDKLWVASRQAHVNDEWEPGEDG